MTISEKRSYIAKHMSEIEQALDFYTQQANELKPKLLTNLSEAERNLIENRLYGTVNMRYLCSLAVTLQSCIQLWDDLGDVANDAGRTDDALDSWKQADTQEGELYHVVETIITAIRQ